MVDPKNITRYDRSTEELEEFLLFCLVVAGKTAAVQRLLLEDFLGPEGVEKPFAYLRSLIEFSTLRQKLEQSRIGQYNKLEKAFRQLACSDLDLRTCSVEALERIHGIGFKSSRFFIVHSRPDQPYAILDTHILKFLRDVLGIVEVPASTPSSYRQYRELESRFVEHCRALGRSVADVDLEIWNQYARDVRQAA